ncbi:ABC transporter ATP-binding protein [Salinisphaera sp. G21_0]|uniref:ABC transporter ATP-binding protein n=1 Tax=Salinisphaera sp. G21_0 TaxID=2821094 RepID=UPI001ADBB64A|nr:ABC transporter ATP-binding protein [Salinisphaera sp. G21_0]MBO9484013.1 ABC transporter ATP-binding protein [Salinisphaera sp. G21_0]
MSSNLLSRKKKHTEITGVAIRVIDLSKVYQIYNQPLDRLKQLFFPFIRSLVGLKPKKYHRELYALHNISFEVKKGESVGIIGRNGSGKSTLLQIISGITNHTKGDIEVNGRVSGLLELGSGFNLEFTGRENIYLNGALFGIKKKEMDGYFKDILEFSEIGQFIDQPIKYYSSGMLMRLAFSVHAILEPEVLIIDEALSVGDIYFQQKCFSHLKYNLTGCSKIFVTHDMVALSALTERVVIIDGGYLVFDGELQKGIKTYNRIMHNGSKINLLQNEKEGGEKKQEKPEKPELQIKNAPDDRIIYQKPPIEQITGIGNVYINEVAITVDGKINSVVRYGSVVEINMKVECLSDNTGQLVFGFFTRNRYSHRIFGQNSLSCNKEDILQKKGGYIVSFNFSWPRVESGEYTLTLGIGEINPFTLTHEVQCWINDFMAFSCLTDEPEHGLLSVDLYNLNISNNEEF